MENYQNLVGKLLAGENITILQKRMETAAFDVKARTLYLPIWKDMTPEINDMLICHEVSHALFTPMDYVDALETRLKFQNAKSYLNILEDIRAEKLIKRKYPGIKKSFAVGYQQLNERDFFGVKEKDLPTCHLMDKINLFYKVGFTCGVKFTEEEKVFVDRASTTETIHDVIQLAEDIFKFLRESKTKPEEHTSKPAKGKIQIETDDDVEPIDSDSAEDTTSEAEDSESGSANDSNGESTDDEGSAMEEDSAEGSDSASGGSGASSTEEGEESEDVSVEEDNFEDDDIITDSAFSEKARSIIDMSEEREYLEISPSQSKRIVPYSVILKSFNYGLYQYSIDNINTFKDSAKDVVSYLVKEFEMKKAATSYKNNTISKSGIIDIKKLYAYKIKDDLFRRISIAKDGKNHGMIILIDWSGSMKYVIKEALKQAITLAMFCRRVNIPFQVLAFADGRLPNDWSSYVSRGNFSADRSNINEEGNFYFLMELFSDKMTNNDMKRMIDFTLSNGVNSMCPLNGTPLTESLIYMHDHIGKFIASNNVEKFTFITLTDGAGARFGYYHSSARDENNKVIKKRYFIKTASGRMIEFEDDTASQTNGVLSAIREKYNCKVVGFYIGSTSSNDLNEFIIYNYGSDFYYSDKCDTLKNVILKECKKDGMCCINDIPGYNMMFFVPAKKLKINDDELSINPNDNVKKIAKDFSKHLTKKKNSRVLLNEFIKIIA